VIMAYYMDDLGHFCLPLLLRRKVGGSYVR
jgi:hypothetical protein